MSPERYEQFQEIEKELREEIKSKLKDLILPKRNIHPELLAIEIEFKQRLKEMEKKYLNFITVQSMEDDFSLCIKEISEDSLYLD